MTEENGKHLGQIELPIRVLGELLDFEGMKIWKVDVDVWLQKVAIIIEHPDMPFVREQDPVPLINPVYINQGHNIPPIPRMIRTEPKKGDTK